jgi:hypothetical protein
MVGRGTISDASNRGTLARTQPSFGAAPLRWAYTNSEWLPAGTSTSSENPTLVNRASPTRWATSGRRNP